MPIEQPTPLADGLIPPPEPRVKQAGAAVPFGGEAALPCADMLTLLSDAWFSNGNLRKCLQTGAVLAFVEGSPELDSISGSKEQDVLACWKSNPKGEAALGTPYPRSTQPAAQSLGIQQPCW